MRKVAIARMAIREGRGHNGVPLGALRSGFAEKAKPGRRVTIGLRQTEGDLAQAVRLERVGPTYGAAYR